MFLKQVLTSTNGKIQEAVSLDGFQMGEVTLAKSDVLPDNLAAIEQPQLDLRLKIHLIFKKNNISVHIGNKVCSKSLSAYFTNMGIKKFNISRHTTQIKEMCTLFLKQT